MIPVCCRRSGRGGWGSERDLTWGCVRQPVRSHWQESRSDQAVAFKVVPVVALTGAKAVVAVVAVAMLAAAVLPWL